MTLTPLTLRPTTAHNTDSAPESLSPPRRHTTLIQDWFGGLRGASGSFRGVAGQGVSFLGGYPMGRGSVWGGLSYGQGVSFGGFILCEGGQVWGDIL